LKLGAVDLAEIAAVRPSDWVRKWRACLTDCLGSRWQKRLGLFEKLLVIEPSGDGVAEASIESPEGCQALGTIPAGDPALAKTILGPKIDGSERVVLRVPATWVLTKRLGFPRDVESNLTQVLGFEMDRLTPFPSDSVYYDHRVVGRAAEQNRIQVELAVLTRDAVRPWLDLLVSAGLRPALVEARGLWKSVNLLPKAERPHERRISLLGVLVSFVLIGLFIAVLGLPLWQYRSIALELSQKVDAARPVANEVADLRQRLEKSKNAAQAVIAERRKSVYMIEVLRELTRLVPDDTWVQQFDLKGGNLQLRGESANAAALIKKLTESGSLAGVAFQSPVTRDPRSGKERYHISARVSPRDGS